MNTCPLCDASIPTGRPRHRVVLAVEDRTRPAEQIMGNETDIERYCINKQLCLDCWKDLREDLS